MKKYDFSKIIKLSVFSMLCSLAQVAHAATNHDAPKIKMKSSAALPNELKEHLNNIQSHIITYGYHEEDNEYAKYLLGLKHEVNMKVLPSFTDSSGENDFLKDPKKLKLATPKNFPSFLMKKNLLGSAPIGSWVKDKKGWSGYKLFFEQDKKTVCAFSYFNLSLSGGKVLPYEGEKEYIGEKEASSETTGSPNSGFVYSISWFTPDEVKILDCAQANFDESEIKRVKIYAEQIEKSNILK